MEVYQKLRAAAKVWKIEARDVSFLCLVGFLIGLTPVELVHVFLVRVWHFAVFSVVLSRIAFLVLLRLITDRFQSELFLGK